MSRSGTFPPKVWILPALARDPPARELRLRGLPCGLCRRSNRWQLRYFGQRGHFSGHWPPLECSAQDEAEPLGAPIMNDAESRTEPVRSALSGYGLALAMMLLATAARLLLNPLVGNGLPFVTFLMAVVVVSWLAGTKPTLFAIVLSLFIAYWQVDPPVSTMFGYVVICLLVTWVSQQMRSSELRARVAESDAQAGERRLRQLAEERQALLVSERAARSEAEHAGRMKDEFLATLSHELRTPLNAILGYATLIRMSELKSDELEEATATIERNAKLQAQLIEDLLDMNRIVSGKVRLEIQELELAEVIEAAISTVRPSAEAKQIRLQKVIEPVTGLVRGDAARIQQIVWNLLSNAVKFTPKWGKIQVSLARVNSHVEIQVTDTGQGIAPDFLPSVFDRFRQADATTTRRHGGLGLGLAIVKQLVELHGGTVAAASPGEGQGTTFTVTLPVAAVQGVELTSAREHPRALAHSGANVTVQLTGVRVLVVDDEPDATTLVKRVLEEYEAEVVMAESARTAFSLLAEQPFSVLVSDIGMPEEDGYQFLKRVRNHDGLNREIPAVALTAFARAEDRTRAALAGFQTHLSKPVAAGELLAIVANLAGRTGR